MTRSAMYPNMRLKTPIPLNAKITEVTQRANPAMISLFAIVSSRMLRDRMPELKIVDGMIRKIHEINRIMPVNLSSEKNLATNGADTWLMHTTHTATQNSIQKQLESVLLSISLR